jgi:outer membrane receptor protein involved in Fe transport
MRTRALGLLVGASLIALSGQAFAQAAPSAGAAAAAPTATAAEGEELEAIVVTGSRIVRDGFQAPTPVTTLAQDALLNRAPSNIPDALNQLPQFRNSSGNSRSVTWNANEPNQGNYLNLRGLGTRRSLILLDGVRVPPTSFAGGVDINTLPQALVQRVDVVTGGASAAYGSDALVGVVNFVLDKNFNGIKGSAQAGISSRGDGESYRATLAAGTPFADGRGHIEGSYEYFQQRPVNSNDRENGRKFIQYTSQNRTIGGRSVQHSTTYEGVRFATNAFGGYIGTGPLAGYEFLPNGGVRPMLVGEPTTNPLYSVGGGGAYFYGHTMISQLETHQAFSRVSYDLTDNVNVHLQGSYAQSLNALQTRVDDRFLTGNQTMTIFADNPYLRSDVRAMLGNTPSFVMSRISYDTPTNWARALNTSTNINFGFDGKFSAFGKDWNWDANYVYGRNYLRTKVNEFNERNFYAAIDAVRAPNGDIVCGVTLRNPGLLPGCVPMNMFGVGAPSQAAIDWATWYSKYRVVNGMNILAANLNGELFTLPAGPVSIAVGAEYRKQTLEETTNSNPALAPTVDYTGIRGVPNNVAISHFTNIGTAAGTVKVKEAYAEVAVPVLRDLPFAQSLDLNAAIRFTDYSTSGTVHTYKVGFSYVPFNDLRFRGTVSRDITAPSLYQLFQGPQVTTNLDLDLHTGVSASYVRESRGNPELTPEIGSMVVAGAVYSPSFIPGLTLSVDGYSLYITDAIGSTNQGDLNRQCEDSGGTDSVCQYIVRPLPFSNRTPANNWTRVYLLSLNQAKVFQSGFDIETSYRFPLSNIRENWGGNLELRALATVITANRTKQNPTLPTQNQLDIGTTPRILGSVEGTYNNGPWTVRVANRWTGSSRRSITSVFTNYADLPSVTYTDVTINYKFGRDNRYEAFLNVQNLFDTQPPLQADSANPGLQFPTNRAMYDVMGRYMTAGLRFRM